MAGEVVGRGTAVTRIYLEHTHTYLEHTHTYLEHTHTYLVHTHTYLEHTQGMYTDPMHRGRYLNPYLYGGSFMQP